MPQSNHTVWTAYVSPVEDEVNAGDVLTLNAAGTGYVVATLANRTAASRTTTAAGIALTEWDSTNPNRAVQIQTVGPYPQGIADLGTGTATTIRVSDAGRLERGASAPVAGNCDADGMCYLNFTGSGGGGGGDTVTFSGDLSGPDAGPQVVERIKGTTVTTAGGALPVGAVLRTTAVGTADWGALDLADNDARTGLLPVANIAAGTNGDVLTTAGGVTTWAPAGSGAPLSAQYLTLALDASLSAERRFVPGAGLSATDGGANGNYTLTSQGPTSSIPDSPSVSGNRVDDYDASVGGVPSDLIHVTYNTVLHGGGLTITSIANPTENRRITVLNGDDGTFGTSVIIDHAAATGTAANRILCPGAADITLAARESALLQYDTATDRWRVVSKTPAAAFTAPTGTGFMTTTSGSMNAASTNPANVGTYQLTDTSAAQYDLLVHNGTSFRRQAKGSNSTVWQVTAGGVGQYGQVTPAMISGGSNGNLLSWTGGVATWNNTVAYVGESGTVATVGFVRCTNNSNIVVARNAANSANIVAMCTDNADGVRIGFDSAGANQATNIRLNAVSFIYDSINGTNYLVQQSSYVAALQPLHVGSTIGGSVDFTNKFRFARAAVAVSAGSSLTLTAAQYSCPYIVLTGTGSAGTFVLTPSTDGAFYVVQNSTSNPASFGEATDDAESIASGRVRIFIGDASIGSLYRNAAPEGDT